MKCDQKDFKSGSVSYGHEVVRPACFQVDWGLHPVLLLPPSVSPSLPWSSNSTTFKTLLYFNSSILSINTSRATILTHYHVSDSPSWKCSEYEEREYQHCTVSYRFLTLLPSDSHPVPLHYETICCSCIFNIYKYLNTRVCRSRVDKKIASCGCVFIFVFLFTPYPRRPLYTNWKWV